MLEKFLRVQKKSYALHALFHYVFSLMSEKKYIGLKFRNLDQVCLASITVIKSYFYVCFKPSF